MAHHEGKESTAQKREYLSPVLARYGALRDLTQSGTKTGTESQKGANKARKPA